MTDSLARFLSAQEEDYSQALREVQSGRKTSHWMWHIFPQIQGLGRSYTAQYYAIQNRREAESYWHHPVLGPRLGEITTALLLLEHSNAAEIFGYTDAMKLRSSMTLFAAVSDTDLFQRVLDQYFDGKPDDLTLQILQKEEH